jgi:hypothetical protein
LGFEGAALAPWSLQEEAPAFAKLWLLKLRRGKRAKRPERAMLSVAVLALEYFWNV